MLRLLSKQNLTVLAVLALLGLSTFWWLTIPKPILESALPAHQGDVQNGLRLYNVGGCHSCHLPGTADIAQELPAGGKAFKTPIGILYPPNLTPDPETGLGNWTDIEFVNAMQRGIGRNDEHLIPAFPYTSYENMKVEDVLDIRAYLASLPAIKNPSKPHDVLALPIIRRGLGLWKFAGLDTEPFVPDANVSASFNRGKYLVEGPGHCNECHTPRTALMTSDTSRLFAGGPHPDGEGNVPSLRDLLNRKRYKDAADLKTAFQNGEILGYDKMSSGGMAAVQINLSKLPEEDVAAIAEYLMSLK